MSPPSQPVLWVDPGKMTGIAVWWPPRWEKDDPFIDEFDFMGAGDNIRSICQGWKSDLRMGWEHFTIHPKTPPADAHYAIEVIGVCRRYAMQHGCRMVGPALPEQRRLATPRMLEAIGWWRPGKDDAQSAAQHLLAWMMRSGSVPDREAGILASIR